MGKRKDARWQYASEMAELLGVSFETCAPEDWQALLDRSEEFLRVNPGREDQLAEKWRNEP